MSRKTSGPKKPKNGANGGRQASSGADNGAEDSKIIRLTATPAFELWLDRQTKRIVDASARAPGQELVDLIRNWSGNNPKKDPGNITD